MLRKAQTKGFESKSMRRETGFPNTYTSLPGELPLPIASHAKNSEDRQAFHP
jgi:hypothetical protein